MDAFGPSSEDNDVFSRLPQNLSEKLMPFQREGIIFAIRKNGKCLIADEMGLGKTIQAISIAYYYKHEWPLLIIVPSSLRYCWIEEMEKWLPDIHPHDINLIQTGADASGIATAKVTITTFGLLSKKTSHIVLEALDSQKFKVVIIDESHYIRNSKTASCKAVVPLVTNADRRILLSGTPALSKPVELFPQIDALYPGKFGLWWQFTTKYCNARVEWIGGIKKRNVNGASNLEELQSRLANTLMIRREKSEVLKQLPPKQRQKVLFDLKDSGMKKELKKSFAELLESMRKSNSSIGQLLRVDNSSSNGESAKENFHVLSMIQQLYRLSGEAKIGPVREYVEMLCENSQLKFLVFAYHHSMMNGVQQSLWEKRVKFIRIDGETKPSERLHLVQQFQSDPDTRVAILSILAAGVGLTFTAAKLVVFAEMYWTPGVLVQCEDRAHRIGQTAAVPVHYLVAKDTMDEWVWSAVCKKTIVTTTALTGRKQALKALEGDNYQIDVLSNAEAWVPNQDKNLDLSEYLQSQQPQDQKSILQFFSSQSTPQSAKSTDNLHITTSTSETTSSQLHSKSVLTENSDDGEDLPILSAYSTGKKKVLQKRTPKVGRKRQRTNSCNSMSDELSTKKVKSYSDCKSPIIVIDSDEEKDFKIDSTKRNKKLRKTSKKKKDTMARQNTVEENGRSATRKDLGPLLVSDRFTNCESNNERVSASPNVKCETKGPTEVNWSCDLEVNWSCDRCTYLNNSVLPYCEICDTPRKAASKLKTIFNNGSSTEERNESETIVDNQPVFNDSSGIKDDEMDFASTYDRNSKREEKCSVFTSKDLGLLGRIGEVYCSATENKPADTEKVGEFKDSESLFSNTTGSYSVDSPRSSNLSNDSDASSDMGNFDLSQTILEANTGDSDVIESSHSECDKEEVENGVSVGFGQVDFDGEGEGRDETDNGVSFGFGQDSSDREGGDESENDIGVGLSHSDHDGEERGEFGLDSDMANGMFDDWDSDIESGAREDSPAVKERVVNLDNIKVYGGFLYCCSKYTGRVYLFDKEGESLGYNFLPLDVEIGNQDGLPELLLHPVNLRLAQKFVREWNSLSETKQRLVVKQGQLFLSPMQAYEAVKSRNTNSKQRHRTKLDTASSAVNRAREINGTLRVITRPQSGSQQSDQTEPTDLKGTEGKGVLQAVDETGIPLCLNCLQPYKNHLLQKRTITSEKNAWQTRFCSTACMDTYWMKTNSEYCRNKLQELEHGVCQLCNFDAQNFYRLVRDCVDLKKRADIIAKSKFHKLKTSQKEQMAKHPVAGQFWHADHIKPVWEGGGQCDIDNLRTLCVICHQKVTAGQARKRANIRRLSSAAGASDITAFFSPL
ncbi:hypothetical protein ScPMuIL_014695 [Solemya velum]